VKVKVKGQVKRRKKIKGDCKGKGFSTSLRTTSSEVKVQRRKSGSQLKTSANFWKELCSARNKRETGIGSWVEGQLEGYGLCDRLPGAWMLSLWNVGGRCFA
jgi:hypothetical protein